MPRERLANPLASRNRRGAGMRATTSDRFSFERLCFDRWAAWAEGQWEQGLGLPGETLLSKVQRFGIRVGVAHASNEPELRDEPEIVSKLMEEWASARPLPHCALLARHRRIVEGVKVQMRHAQGRWRPLRDADLAVLILKDYSDLGRKRIRRLCEEGYAELRLRLHRL